MPNQPNDPKAIAPVLFVSVSADNNRYAKVDSHPKKVAPAAYVISERGELKWGKAYMADTHALFAHGVIHFLDDILIEDDDRDFLLTVVLEKDGARKFFEEYALNWIAKGGKNSINETPMNFDTWKRALSLSQLGRLSFRKPENVDESLTLSRMKELAKRKAASMPDCTFSTVIGVTEIGGEEGKAT